MTSRWINPKFSYPLHSKTPFRLYDVHLCIIRARHMPCLYASQSIGYPSVVARDFASAGDISFSVLARDLKALTWGSSTPAAFNARNAALFDLQEFLPSTELKVSGALIVQLWSLLYASHSFG